MSAPTSVRLESVGCLLGCPPGDDFVLTGRERLLELPGEFTVVRCRTCGLLRTNPRPSAESMAFYYPADYGPHLGNRVPAAAASRPVWRSRLAAAVWRIFESNAERLPPLTPGHMLEIGCGSGGFLRRMEGRGWRAEGIEPSLTAGAEARSAGLSVQIGSVKAASPPKEPFDLVVGWMVLEHLHDPVADLKRIREWTKPGGVLAASVPNAACWELRAFGERWYTLHLPNHLWHPTPESLRRILEAGGWRVEKLLFHRDVNNVVGSLGHWLSDRRILPPLARFLKEYPGREGRLGFFLLHPIGRLLALLRQTGRLTVWARRLD